MNTLPDLFGHVHKIMEKKVPFEISFGLSPSRSRYYCTRLFAMLLFFEQKSHIKYTTENTHNNYSHANLCLTRLVCVAPFKSCPLLIFAHTFSSRYLDRKPKSNFLLGFWHYRSNYCSASFVRLATPNIDNETLHSEW